MQTLQEKFEHAKQILSQNKPILISIKGLYYFLSLSDKSSVENLHKIKNKPLAEEIVYLFSDIQKLEKYVVDIPQYLNFVTSVFSPEPIFSVLNSNKALNNNSNIVVCLAVDDSVQDFLHFIDSPLALTSANIHNYPIATNKEMMNNYFPNQDFEFLSFCCTNRDFVQPAVIDYTKSDSIEICRPGNIDISEIGSILPGKVQVRNNFEKRNRFWNLYSVKNLSEIDKVSGRVVLGTKEKLREVFGVSVGEYFNTMEFGDYTLINLGSSTNMETVARNLFDHLTLADKVVDGGDKYLLWQDWGKNYWGKLVSHYLNEFCSELNLELDKDDSKELTSEINPGNFLGDIGNVSLA